MNLNWEIVVLGIISLLAGAWLNDYLNKKNNERLIEQLKAELLLLASKEKDNRVSADNKKEIIQAQIAILEKAS